MQSYHLSSISPGHGWQTPTLDDEVALEKWLKATIFGDREPGFGEMKQYDYWLKRIWNPQPPFSSGQQSESLQLYFNIIRTERRNFANRAAESIFSKLKLEDITSILGVIVANCAVKRDDLCGAVSQLLNSRALAHSLAEIPEIVELVIRVSCLVRIKFCDVSFKATARELPFLRNNCLKRSIADIPVKSSYGQSARAQLEYFPPWFNVIDLEKKTGLRIEWTGYINDHLLIFINTLYLFCDLETLQQLQNSQTMSNIFDSDFIEETLRSIRLFFPQHRLYRKWFKTHKFRSSGRCFQLDQQDFRNPYSPRGVEDYPIWKKRLLEIAKYSVEDESYSLKRLWNDDRNKSLWWTQWGLIIAVFLAVLFGLIQSITGIIQVVYAAPPG